jgi:hypothetical protein
MSNVLGLEFWLCALASVVVRVLTDSLVSCHYCLSSFWVVTTV